MTFVPATHVTSMLDAHWQWWSVAAKGSQHVAAKGRFRAKTSKAVPRACMAATQVSPHSYGGIGLYFCFVFMLTFYSRKALFRRAKHWKMEHHSANFKIILKAHVATSTTPITPKLKVVPGGHTYTNPKNV